MYIIWVDIKYMKYKDISNDNNNIDYYFISFFILLINVLFCIGNQINQD